MALIGVSIAVPDPAGAELQEFRISLGETGAARIPTHITLVPPTNLAAADLPAVVAHLDSVVADHARFDVHLRGTGTFRPVSPVVFVNLVEGISECELLAKSIRDGPLALALDFPYHPHVTVAHELPAAALDRAFAELAGFEATFSVDGFWLYTYDDESGWLPDRCFRLGGPGRMGRK